jgi:annexin A7/11
MKGFGCDDTAIIAIIGRKSPVQMQQISQAFKACYGKDLTDKIASETSGDYGRLCVALTKNLAQYDAECLQDAVIGFGTDEEALIEILAGRSNAEIHAIRSSYALYFGVDLVQGVANDLSGKLKNMFVALLQGQRDETGMQN